MLLIVAPYLFKGRGEEYIFDSLVQHFTFRSDIQCDAVELGRFDQKHFGNDLFMEEYYMHMARAVIGYLAKHPRSVTKILWCDGWHPGIPLVRHYLEATNQRYVQHYAIVHGSTWIKGDYLDGSRWAESYENHIMRSFDKVFVATHSLRSDFARFRNVHVTGLPFNKAPIQNYGPDRRYNIIFPHRWNYGKAPEKFVELAQWWSKNIDDGLRFQILTSDSNLADHLVKQYEGAPFILDVVFNRTKQEYYDNIGQARYVWSGSTVETFGIAVAEAYISGCIPILNNNEVYEELYSGCIYRDFDQMVNLIKTLKYNDVKSHIILDAEERIAKHIL